MDITIREDFRDRLPEARKTTDDALRRSLFKYGCYEPLVLWNGVLVDGHRRYRICQELGIDPPIREMEFADEGAVLDFIDTNQLSRRNLTPVELAEVSVRAMQFAGAVPKSKHGRHPKHGEKTGNREKVLAEVSEELGISPRTIKRHEELVEAKGSLPIELQLAASKDQKAGFKVIKRLAELTKSQIAEVHERVEAGLSITEALAATVAVKPEAPKTATYDAASVRESLESPIGSERVYGLASELSEALGRFAAVVHKVRTADKPFYTTMYHYVEDLQNEISTWKDRHVRPKSKSVGTAAPGRSGDHPPTRAG